MPKSDDEIRRKLLLGTEAYKCAEYEKAIKHFGEFLKQQDAFADVYNMLGQSYHYLGRLDEAIEAFRKGLEVNPRYTELAINLTITLLDLGRYEEAREVQRISQAATEKREDGLDPYALKKLANMHAEIADAYHALGLHDNAIEEYVKALHLAPSFPDVRTKLAEVYRDKGLIADALRELRQLKTSRPNYIPARMALGITYYADCKIPEAIAEWKEITKLDPENKAAKAYLRLVQADAKCGGKPLSAAIGLKKRKKV